MVQPQTMNTPPVHKTVLDNGLTLLVREDRSAPVVAVQAWVRAGSITEGRWMGAGLSHVLEHMLFKGTTTRGVAQIAQEIEDHGGYINAFTSFENTVYHIDMPSENWRKALEILADCMINATIPEEELAKEKQVILREMAMNNDDPVRRASRLLWSTAYTTHPYRHPVIGYPDIYERTTRDDVVAYYKRHYVPNNMLFVVVGDVRAAEVESALRQRTRDFKRAAIEPLYVPAEPPQLSLRERHEEMPTELSRIHLAWHIPSVTHPDIYALDVLAIILGHGNSSRLFRQVREKQGLVHTISASSYTPAHPGLFIVEATSDPQKRHAAIAAIRDEVRKCAAQLVSAAELQKAIKTSVSHYLQRLKTMDGQASDIAHNEILVGDPNFSQTYLENLRKVTRQDVQRVARQYLTDNNLTITSLNPTATVRQAAATLPAVSDLRIQKFELPNGLRLLVRQDPKLPLVDLRATLKGGVIAETQTNNGISKLTARMLLKGTKKRTAEQIAETMESVGGNISYFSGNNSFGISASALSEDVDLALDVLADVLQNPTFPDAMLARERDVQLAEIKAEQDQILRAGQQLLREAMYTRHPYRLNPLGKPDTVSKLDGADLRDFHRRYVVPNNIVLTVFGNVDAQKVRKTVEAKFGALKPVKPEFPQHDPETLSADLRKIEVRQKEQAVVLIGYSGADLFSPDRFALELLNEACSGMGSRLFLRIREELGLAYYVGAYQLLGLQPGYFAFYAGTAPDNLATCQKEFFAALDTLKAHGLSAEELDRAKNSIIGQRRVRMQDNSELAMIVALDELYGLGYDFFKTMEERYRAVTAEDIKRVAAAYFAGKPRAVVLVTPSAPEN